MKKGGWFWEHELTHWKDIIIKEGWNESELLKTRMKFVDGEWQRNTTRVSPGEEEDPEGFMYYFSIYLREFTSRELLWDSFARRLKSQRLFP